MQVLLVSLVLLVLLDQVELGDNQAQKAPLDLEVLLDQWEAQDHLECQEHPESQESREIQELLVHWV